METDKDLINSQREYIKSLEGYNDSLNDILNYLKRQIHNYSECIECLYRFNADGFYDMRETLFPNIVNGLKELDSKLQSEEFK